MKTFAQIIFLLLLSVPAFAQKFSSEMWHEGVVDLKEGKTLKGKIKYNLETDIILLDTKTKVLSLNPDNVESFQLLDALTARMRYFFALPYALENNYTRNYFFELLAEGEKNLLTREQIVQQTRYYNDPFWIGATQGYTTLVQKENYFLMNNEARISEFESSKELIESAFSKHYDKIKRYIKSNRLRTERREDMMMVADYYNSLESSD